MRVRPVVFYRKPAYPTAKQLAAGGQKLRCLPLRWARNGTVVTALGMLLAVGGCGAPEMETQPAGNAAGDSVDAADLGGSAPPENVAFVFVHGEGVGSFACVAVTAPWFFSEEEALAVIRAEAEQYGGIRFQTEEPVALDQVLVSEDRKDGVKEVPLKLDGADQERAVGFEFVSQEDVTLWGQMEYDGYGGASYDMRKAAEGLRERLALADTGMKLGVFYDPYDEQALIEAMEEATGDKDFQWAMTSEGQEEWERRAREMAEENLRAQVRDFLDWLSGQGVI